MEECIPSKKTIGKRTKRMCIIEMMRSKEENSHCTRTIRISWVTGGIDIRSSLNGPKTPRIGLGIQDHKLSKQGIERYISHNPMEICHWIQNFINCWSTSSWSKISIKKIECLSWMDTYPRLVPIQGMIFNIAEIINWRGSCSYTISID